MQSITSQRDQHPNNRGSLHSFLHHYQAATWKDAPVDTDPGREDANYSSEATLEARGNFARDFYHQNEEFRNYADTEEKYGGSPSSWDPFTWAEVFDGFADFKELSGGATVARRSSARRKSSSMGWSQDADGQYTAEIPNGVVIVSETEENGWAYTVRDSEYSNNPDVDYAENFPTADDAIAAAEREWEGHGITLSRKRAARHRSARKVTSSLNWVADDRGIYEAQGPDGATYIVGYSSARLIWLAERAKKDGFDYIEFGFFTTEAEAKAVVEEFVNGERTARRRSARSFRTARRQKRAALNWSDVVGEEDNYSASGPDGIEFLIYPSGGSYSVRWTLDVLNTPQGRLHYPEAFESQALAANMAEQFVNKWDQVKEMLAEGPVDYTDVQDIPWKSARRKTAALQWSEDQPGYFTAEVPGGTLVVQHESVYGWGWFAYQGDPDDGEPAIDSSVNFPNADEAKAEAEQAYGNGVDPDSGGGVTARRKTASNILDGYRQWCKQYGYDPEDVDQYANQYAESSVEANFIIDQIFDFDFVDGAADPVDFEEWVNGEEREASREGRRRKARGPKRSSAR